MNGTSMLLYSSLPSREMEIETYRRVRLGKPGVSMHDMHHSIVKTDDQQLGSCSENISSRTLSTSP